DSSALIYGDGEQIHGTSCRRLLELANTADLLVNISGHLAFEPVLDQLGRKAYIDIDPGFTQFWHVTNNAGAHLSGHDFYFTIGENIGNADCSIPNGSIHWRPIRQPVVLEDWPVVKTPRADRFTTVASWRGPYGPVEYGGRTWGLKV